MYTLFKYNFFTKQYIQIHIFSYSLLCIFLHLVMFTCQLQIRPRTSHCLTSCSCSPSMISSRSASLLIRAPTRLNLSRSSRCFLSSGNTFSKSSRFFASFPFLFADDSICKIIYKFKIDILHTRLRASSFVVS